MQYLHNKVRVQRLTHEKYGEMMIQLHNFRSDINLILINVLINLKDHENAP